MRLEVSQQGPWRRRVKLGRRQIAIIIGAVVVLVLVVAVLEAIGGGSTGEEGVPLALTAAEKNAQRQEDLRRLLDKSNEYRAEHGALPQDLAGWQEVANSLADWRDPDGSAYKLVQACDYNTEYCVMPDALGWEQNKDQVYVAWHAACASGALAGMREDSAVAAYVALEDARPVCLDK